MSKETCIWTYGDDRDLWNTECDHVFCLGEGLPLDDDIIYCPFCGKTIIIPQKISQVANG